MYNTDQIHRVPFSPFRQGHAPDDLRSAFLEALEDYYKQRGAADAAALLNAACGPLWNCTDVLPGSDCDLVAAIVGVERRGYSYAAAARQLRAFLNQRIL